MIHFRRFPPPSPSPPPPPPPPPPLFITTNPAGGGHQHPQPVPSSVRHHHHQGIPVPPRLPIYHIVGVIILIIAILQIGFRQIFGGVTLPPPPLTTSPLLLRLEAFPPFTFKYLALPIQSHELSLCHQGCRIFICTGTSGLRRVGQGDTSGQRRKVQSQDIHHICHDLFPPERKWYCYL